MLDPGHAPGVGRDDGARERRAVRGQLEAHEQRPVEGERGANRLQDGARGRDEIIVGLDRVEGREFGFEIGDRSHEIADRLRADHGQRRAGRAGRELLDHDRTLQPVDDELQYATPRSAGPAGSACIGQ